MTLKALRTPDDRFTDLPGYDFDPNYIETLAGYEGQRMHYLDEGPSDAENIFLCLHGQPTWSYLYRKMIPVFTSAGHRVIAPDLFGFGKSDKPIEDSTYTFHFHRNSLLSFIDALGLKRITLACQDWGGILGLTIPVDKPDLISRLLVMNTGIGIGKPAGKGFDDWKAYAASQPDMDVAKLMGRSTPILSEAEKEAYAAPFPDMTYKAGVRRFPELVPISPEMEGTKTGLKALQWWREQWQGESFMAIGMQDPVLGPPAMHNLRKNIRNCPPPLEIEDGGHFLQEWGEEIARAALAHWSKGS